MVDLYPKFKAGSGTLSAFLTAFKQCTNLELYPFSCGRAAMVFGLRALGMQRTDEILVPPFLGHCVLSALARTSFPALAYSKRTRAIMVYHQFGFPQRIDLIEPMARKKGWVILNNLANTIFSQCQGERLLGWGDFTVVSLSKLFPCAMGGGFVSTHPKIRKQWRAASQQDHRVQRVCAEKAHHTLVRFHRQQSGNVELEETRYEIEAAYGYLPELIPFPLSAAGALPQTKEELLADAERRRTLWLIAQDVLPNRVPHCLESDVVPFAIPVRGSRSEIQEWSRRIKRIYRVEAPLLHFDWNRNILKPEYRRSLILGCHSPWSEEMVRRICTMIRTHI